MNFYVGSVILCRFGYTSSGAASPVKTEPVSEANPFQDGSGSGDSSAAVAGGSGDFPSEDEAGAVDEATKVEI